MVPFHLPNVILEENSTKVIKVSFCPPLSCQGYDQPDNNFVRNFTCSLFRWRVSRFRVVILDSSSSVSALIFSSSCIFSSLDCSPCILLTRRSSCCMEKSCQRKHFLTLTRRLIRKRKFSEPFVNLSARNYLDQIGNLKPRKIPDCILFLAVWENRGPTCWFCCSDFSAQPCFPVTQTRFFEQVKRELILLPLPCSQG